MGHNVGVSYGVLSDSISKQLRAQKLKFDKEKVSVFQKEMDAINQLRFGSRLLTDGMADRLFAKLHKKILAHVAKANGQYVVKSK